MGAKFEDLRAIVAMIAVVAAAYLPFYIVLIQSFAIQYFLLFIYEGSSLYYFIIEGIKGIGTLAVSLYFFLRRREEKMPREPLNLPRNVVRGFLLINAVIAQIIGILSYIRYPDIDVLNLPFIFSVIISIIAWLWPLETEIKFEDARAVIAIICVVLAAYLPFYIGLIKFYFPDYTFGYFIITEGIQGAGSIAISAYFSLRRHEETKPREPLDLPRNVIRGILIVNTIIAAILGVISYSSTQDFNLLNLPFVISLVFSVIIWLWPS
ncbi:MAG: hypothetical protein HWN67_05200 [Candidatus Helarchaeota archaeon]|nr:hypothetical protein [Candidatus Helarchaeota archaeon]